MNKKLGIFIYPANFPVIIRSVTYINVLWHSCPCHVCSGEACIRMFRSCHVDMGVRIRILRIVGGEVFLVCIWQNYKMSLAF